MIKPYDDSDIVKAASERARQVRLDDIDVSDWNYHRENTLWPYFARLRDEDPLHYHKTSRVGPFWSITKHADIRQVELDHRNFSSQGSINLLDQRADFPLPMFIAMDPPKHDVQRKVVAPPLGPGNLKELEPLIRKRVVDILEQLPINEEFDWVDRVSVELTTQMLATLLDFPFEERRKLTRWSDVTSGGPETGVVATHEQRDAELLECLDYFTTLWNEKASKTPAHDMISLLAHNPATQNMEPMEYLGNVLLLIVGGNDTTRNSISGGLLALNLFPDEYRKLRHDPGKIPNMVSEIIRWQTPIAYMRRTALADSKVGGKKIRKGDKVALWYISGNRDEEVFERADDFIIDRDNARHHLSFGYGIHRCVGARLAELQLRVLWEEILTRFQMIEITGTPVRTTSNFVHGFTELPVRIQPW